MITIHNLNDFKLGNSLFQIAQMIGHGTKHGFEFGLTEVWKHQHYFKNPLPLLKSKSYKILQEKQFAYYELPPVDDVSLSGYWQHWEGTKHCTDLLRYYFEPSESITEYLQDNYSELLRCPNSIGLHVRGSDYKQFSNFHTNLPEGYYLNALKEICKDWPDNGSDCALVVFTDDYDYAVDILELIGYDEIIIDNNAGQDFHLFSMMKHNIVANSSYSLFAAFLNQNLTKRVVVPKQWFNGPDAPQQWGSIYPEGAIVI